MIKYDLSYPRGQIDYPISKAEREALCIKPPPLPSEFAKQLTLVSGGYDLAVPLRLRPYQIEPIDAITKFNRVGFCGSTRTFKSGMTDVDAFWAMKYLRINGVIAYAETDTSSLVFKTRIKPMIEQNACLRELWDGNEDNLTIENILLRGSFWRIASAQNINDLATFGAGMVIGSEVAKWVKKTFNPVDTLYGRQLAYPVELRKSIMESSPYMVGDYLYKEMYKDGVIILQPYVPCPHCGEYQVLQDYIANRDGSVNQYCIKLREGSTETAGGKKSAQRIRNDREAAVKYECRFCKEEIREEDRPIIARRLIYAAPEIYEGDGFYQKGETILKDGSIVEIEKRRKFNMAFYQWNRLIDHSYTFYECLARFFESYSDPEKQKVYNNEDMSRFTRPKAGRIEIGGMSGKKRAYFSSGPLAGVPEDVLVVTCGIDSQDHGFYYVLQGWGANMASWILRYGFIPCHISPPLPPEEIIDRVKNGILGTPLSTRSGRLYSIKTGFIDRGGHRPADVDYLVSKLFFLQGYIGSPRSDPKKPLVVKSENGNYYLCQKDSLDDIVTALINTEQWYIPQDVSEEFINQILSHYIINKKTPDGNTKIIRVEDGEDHYRDCLILNYAAAVVLQLDVLLLDDGVIEKLREASGGKRLHTVKKEPEKNPRRNNYFGRGWDSR